MIAIRNRSAKRRLAGVNCSASEVHGKRGLAQDRPQMQPPILGIKVKHPPINAVIGSEPNRSKATEGHVTEMATARYNIGQNRPATKPTTRATVSAITNITRLINAMAVVLARPNVSGEPPPTADGGLEAAGSWRLARTDG